MSALRLDAAALRSWADAAVAELIIHTDEINRLNVFPVADADTGTNMLFTMRAAWAQADARAAVDIGGNDVTQAAAALAEGALRGARGNSGVILSQILRGVAEVTAAAADARGGLADIDTAVFSGSLRHAAALVITSMGEAVPGTILSVLQEAATAAELADTEGAELADVVTASAQAAALALDRTPSQLNVLAEAGVVDAGGRGLLVLLDTLTATLTGHAPQRDVYLPSPKQAHAVAATAPAPQYEVMYLLSACDTDGVEKLRARLAELGESVAIAASGFGAPGRPGAGHYSVHVHADDAGAAVEAALEVGRPSRIQITSLVGGGDRHPAGGWSRERAVLAVVDGGGAEGLFTGEGAQILRPDPDVPVSAQQLLHALVNTGAAQVMVLPNGYVAPEEIVAGCAVASDWGIDMVPVPAGSMVQGLAALAVHDPQRRAVDDGYTMARAAAGARYGSVCTAAGEALTWAGTCKPGDGLAIAGDEVVIVGEDIVSAAAGLIDLLLAAGGELVTLLTGAGVEPGVGEALVDHVHRHHLGTEMVTFHTGHRGDALLIGVE